jgi:hypothetical protein
MTDVAIDADLLLHHYDRLTAAEVVEGLSCLGAEGVSRVKEREMAGKNRMTVLRRIAALEGSPPPEPRVRPDAGSVVIRETARPVSPEDASPVSAEGTLPPPPAAVGSTPPPPSTATDYTEPAPAAPGYAQPGHAGPYEQDPARLQQIAAVRNKATKSMVFWGLAVVVAIVISVMTYMNAGPGDRYFVWWGPVVFGIWRVFASASVLFRLRNA